MSKDSVTRGVFAMVPSLLHASACTLLTVLTRGPSAITAAVSTRQNRSKGPARSRRVATQEPWQTPSIVMPFLGIFTLALAARVLFVFFVPGYHSAVGLDNYDSMARGIVAGKGLLDLGGQHTAYRAPLYPLFLAAIYRIAGYRPEMVWVVQCVIGAATAGLTFVLARAFFSQRFSWLAGLVAAVYPPLLLSCGTLLSETLFTFLFLAALCTLAGNLWELTLRRAVVAGALLGLASLTRPIAFFFPFAVAAGMVFVSLLRRGRWQILAPVCFMACFLLVLAPWAVRNARVLGSPVLTTTEGGSSLWIGWHPDRRGFGFNINEKLVAFLNQAGVTGELQVNRFLDRACTREIASQPTRFLALALLKVGWFFNTFDGEDYGLGTRYNLPCALVLTLSILGMVLGRRLEGMALLVGTIAYFVLFAAILYGVPRFRIPLEPVLIALAVVGLESVVKMPMGHRRLWSAGICAIVLLNVGIALSADSMREQIKSILEGTVGYKSYFGGP